MGRLEGGALDPCARGAEHVHGLEAAHRALRDATRGDPIANLFLAKTEAIRRILRRVARLADRQARDLDADGVTLVAVPNDLILGARASVDHWDCDGVRDPWRERRVRDPSRSPPAGCR